MATAGRVTARRATRVLLGCTAAVAVLAAVLGYTIAGAEDVDVIPPPAAAVELPFAPEPPVPPDQAAAPSGSASVVPSPTPTPPTASPSATGSGGSGPNGSGPNGSEAGGSEAGGNDGDGTGSGAAAPVPTRPPAAEPPPRSTLPPVPPGPPVRTTPPPPPPPPPPPAPRILGPTDLDGLDEFLGDYCQQRRFLGARLLDGRRDDPATGRWVCLRAFDADTIDIGDACRDAFGERARARQLISGDARTFRCFDF